MATLQETWNQFVNLHNGSFLQSWEWGEFQQKIGRDVRRLVLSNGEWRPLDPFIRHLQGAIQFIEMPLPLGMKYWYGARGPAVSNQESGIRNQELSVSALTKKLEIPSDTIFLRLDPAWGAEHRDTFISNGWRETADIQPRRNWVVDITQPEEDLLRKMHPKTRYNIRLAQAKCTVRRTEGVADGERFWELVEETTERHGIRPHRQRYYQKMLTMPIAELWQAEYEGKIVASQIMIFFGRRATYLHGASSYSNRPLMAPHLLHWKIMQEAKKQGFSEYDLGGIDEARWPGITRFKQGFGGKEEMFVGAFDLPLRPLQYNLYTLGRRLKGR